MQTITLVLLLLGGILCLYVGAELLIIYAARLAISLGMTPIVVGLTVVAFSTSTPELASTLIAQLKGNLSNMALGTIVGSNISNIGLILGLITLFKPLEIHSSVKRFEAPFTVLISILIWLFMFNHKINRFMGIILLIGIFGYVLKHVLSAKKQSSTDKKQEHKIKGLKKCFYFFLIALGIASLTVGGWLLVRGAVGLAQKIGVSDRIIGLTVVALGTSLPEFAASLVAIFRKLGDVAIGNILGSNVFNILFILGVVAIVRPIYFSQQFISKDAPILIGFSILLWILVSVQKKLNRISGLLLFACYAGYIYWVS